MSAHWLQMIKLFFSCFFIDAFMEEFCCGLKSKLFQDPSPSQSSCSWNQSDRGSTEPPYRTDTQPGYGDPGGGGAVGPGVADRLHAPHSQESGGVLELKRSQQCYGPSSNNNSYPPTGNSPAFTAVAAAAAASGGQTHYQGSHHVSSHSVQPQYPPQLTSPPHPDTDSALEAAVNSILEC